jgi:hypothetical protein
MIGELDAGNPHVQFDEGTQETCDIATRLRPTLPQPLAIVRCNLQFKTRKYLTAHTLSSAQSQPQVALPEPGGERRRWICSSGSGRAAPPAQW